MGTGSRGVRGSTPLFLDSSRSGRGAHGPGPAGGRSRERGEYKGETGPDSSRGREVVESDCLGVNVCRGKVLGGGGAVDSGLEDVWALESCVRTWKFELGASSLGSLNWGHCWWESPGHSTSTRGWLAVELRWRDGEGSPSPLPPVEAPQCRVPPRSRLLKRR